MITVSVCMIVKNEEALLSRCLDCLKDLADEIIIVDTGSTDNTREIAKRYTQHIYDYKWEYDFSKARNFALSKASMDYIYTADADEIIDSDNLIKFHILKESLSPSVEIVQMLYGNQLSYNTTYNFDTELRPKLFKRIRTFQFIEPIHETLRLTPVVLDSDICITHMPASNHAARDFSSFVRLHKRQHRLSAHLHNMYARELCIAGSEQDFIDAVPTFQDTLNDTARSLEEIKEATVILAKAARIQNRLHDFFTYALKNMACNSCAELCYELGEYYYNCKDYEEACIWYENAAYETECILNFAIKKSLALQGLAKCYEAAGYPEKARELLQSTLS